MLLLTDKTADYQRFPAVHAHVGVSGAAGDAVVFQLADEHRRAHLSVDAGGHHFTILADDGRVLQLDAGVKIFRCRVAAATVMLFCLHGDVVTDENAGLLAGYGDDARCCQNARFTVAYESIKRSVETEGKPAPKFKAAVIIAAVTVTVVRFLLALGNSVLVPAYAQVFTVLAADGDDFCF